MTAQEYVFIILNLVMDSQDTKNNERKKDNLNFIEIFIHERHYQGDERQLQIEENICKSYMYVIGN
jgi:hypothetical protein